MILILLADGCEEIEALTPLDVMRRADLPVVTASITETLQVTGAHGITITADTTLHTWMAQNPVSSLKMLFLPGGMPGTKNLDACPAVDQLLKTAYANGAYLAAICAAPMILGKRGMLRGKHAVCYPSFEKYLEGAEVEFDDVAIDGHIMTSRSMGTALSFALEIVKHLCGAEKYEAVKSSLLL